MEEKKHKISVYVNERCFMALHNTGNVSENARIAIEDQYGKDKDVFSLVPILKEDLSRIFLEYTSILSKLEKIIDDGSRTEREKAEKVKQEVMTRQKEELKRLQKWVDRFKDTHAGQDFLQKLPEISYSDIRDTTILMDYVRKIAEEKSEVVVGTRELEKIWEQKDTIQSNQNKIVYKKEDYTQYGVE